MTSALDKTEANALRSAGWSVLEAGWPDALVYDDSRVMGIEWKRTGDAWRPEQRELARVFSQILGVSYGLARGASGVLALPGGMLPAGYEPFVWGGQAFAIEDDPRLRVEVSDVA